MLLELSYRFESFLLGLENNFVVTRLPITSNLKTLCRNFVHKHGKAEEFKYFDETVLIRDNIFKNAQNGWVLKAEIDFNALKSSYASHLWTEPIKLLMEDWPLLAFIEYQKNIFSAAKISLEKGIETDWLLENKYQFKEMLFHRIHLLHNQAKVLLKQKDIAGAVQKILKIMGQMADPEKNYFLYPIKIESTPFYNEYFSILFYHLSDSLAIIRKDSPIQYQQIINQNEKPRIIEKNTFSNELNHIYSFSLNQNINNPSTEQILKSGNLLYAGFWYSAVAILHKSCEENQSPFAKKIIQKLVEKNAPAYWVQFVKGK